ncbi:MAG: DUF4190 domain-containing protein [Roseburia sp.]
MSEEFNNENVTTESQDTYNVNGAPQGGETKGFAIASMICGIASIILMCINGYVGIAAAVVAIVLSVVSNKKIGKNGMAIAGLVCGIVALAIFVVCLIIVAVCGAAVLSMV